MGFIYLNGQILEEKAAKISVRDRSYLFGEGLFETFRSYDGKLPFIKKHLNRLEWSSTFLNISFPTGLDLEKTATDLLAKNNLKDARFKLVLSRTEEPAEQNIVVFCQPYDANEIPTVYKLMVIKNLVNDAIPISTMKTTNYLVKIMARTQAREAGLDDGILLNSRGKVVETASANIFWVDKDGKLWTTPTDQDCLTGVTRQILLDLFKENKITIGENTVTPEEISNMREVFVTNSAVGIKPVAAIDKRQISGGQIGSVTAMIMDLWNKNLKDLLNITTCAVNYV